MGDELSCLSFWLLADETQKGWLNLRETKNLLQAFKFTHMFVDEFGKPDDTLTLAKFRKEFDFNLRSKRGELPLGVPEDEVIIRFDLIRDIFLERGL